MQLIPKRDQFFEVMLHANIVWSATAFWCAPNNILARIFDVACFAMDAILCINLQTWFRIFFNNFVNACWTITCLWRGVLFKVHINCQGFIT